jgi:hypothetical protein
MEVLHPRCAGLDVHKDTVVAAVRLVEYDGSVRRRLIGVAVLAVGAGAEETVGRVRLNGAF